MLRAMTISSLKMDPVTNSPIIILKEIGGKQTLPIWIDLLEATAIAGEIEGVRFSRPMTHDLLKDFMDKTDVKLNYVEICDLRDNTCYTLIHLTGTGKCIPNQYCNRIYQLADISYGKWSLILDLENKVKH